MKINTKGIAQVSTSVGQNLPERASIHTPEGIQSEDYIIIRGVPAVVEQHCHAEVMVSCTGLVFSDAIGIMEAAVGSDLRFYAGHGLTSAEWTPFLDNTWSSPRFATDLPPFSGETSWIKDRKYCTAEVIVPNSPLTMINPPDFADGSFSLLFAVSPAPEPSYINFGDLSVTILDGRVTVTNQITTVSTAASSGTEPTMIGFAFGEGSVTVFVAAGYVSVETIILNAESNGTVSITGPMGIISADFWVRKINLGPRISTLLDSITTGKVE